MGLFNWFKRISPLGRQAATIKELAEGGDSEAQSVLGNLYRIGDGVKQSYPEAIHWFRRSAEGGNAIGQFNLATMSMTGEGVKQDPVEGYQWLLRAAASSPMLARTAENEAIKSQIEAVRKRLETLLTPQQLAEARRRSQDR